MGLLSNLNSLLSFQQSKNLQHQLKKRAIRQYLRVYLKFKKWQKPQSIKEIKWGEQIQGNFLFFDSNHSLQLQTRQLKLKSNKLSLQLTDQFGSFMFEINALNPYNTLKNFEETIKSIRQKYKILQSCPDLLALTIPNIPFMGMKYNNFLQFQNKITKSKFLADSFVSNHPRYQALNNNVIDRRNHVVQLKIPLFKDQNTDKFVSVENQNLQPAQNSIILDTVCFGLGVSSVQCTFSTKNLSHARYIHDQLNIISPIFLALTAGAPFHKGKISQWDVRWPVAQGTVDDRTLQQKDINNTNYIPDSRYSSTNYHLWNGQFNLPQYNDYNLNIKEDQKLFILQQCKDLNIQIDDVLLNYLAYITKRDALIVKQEFRNMEEKESDTSIIELLIGSIWNSVRLKIPINDTIGWRVQFRTMDVQLTPDQNSAFILIIHFITRILHQCPDINLYIPITKLRENFQRAFKNDALRKQKFYFRTNVFEKGQPNIEQLTINEIFFGKSSFLGMFHILIQKMETSISIHQNQKCRHFIDAIYKFLKAKTQGKKLTLAQWMRKFVNQHNQYKKDSCLTKKMIDQMLLRLYNISKEVQVDQNFSRIFDCQSQSQDQGQVIDQLDGHIIPIKQMIEL